MSQTTKTTFEIWVIGLALGICFVLGVGIYLSYQTEQQMKIANKIEGAIAKAKATQLLDEQDEEIARKYNLNFLDLGTKQMMLSRIHKNKKLAESFEYAKEEGLTIILLSYHDISVNWNKRFTIIATDASDEEIITSILGSSSVKEGKR